MSTCYKANFSPTGITLVAQLILKDAMKNTTEVNPLILKNLYLGNLLAILHSQIMRKQIDLKHI